jgi:hypothetical protein
MIASGLIVLYLLSACQIKTNEIIYEINELNPLKDDPTTVGNFESSKFEGFWQVTNLSLDWDNLPIFDHPPMLYIFKKNTVQIFAGTRDWSNNGKLSEINMGWKAHEFMYSDSAIYTREFINYITWIKSYYELSLDGKKLLFGRDRLEKMDIKPWTKENLLGLWYIDYTNNTICIYTFTEDSFVIQTYTDGIPNNEYTHANMAITLTDESFTGRLNFGGLWAEQPETTCYYYIINNKLFLSNGNILIKYVDLN